MIIIERKYKVIKPSDMQIISWANLVLKKLELINKQLTICLISKKKFII